MGAIPIHEGSYPKLTATYMVDNNAARSQRSDHNLQWAKKTLRDIKRAVRSVASFMISTSTKTRASARFEAQ
jgi:hypothetical protein